MRATAGAATSSCQSAPLRVGWQLGREDQISEVVVSDMGSSCHSRPYRLSVRDRSMHMLADFTGETPPNGAVFTIPLQGVAASRVGSVALELAD